MRHSSHTNRRRTHPERGQVLPLLALGMVAVLGLVSLSIDVGRMTITRRQLQNAADAAAHAGVQVLPEDPSDARDAAQNWATKNGTLGTDTLSISVYKTNAADDTIRVTITRTVPYTFARVLNLYNADIGATAVATVGSVKGGAGIMPFGLVDQDTSGPGFGYAFGTLVDIHEPPGNGKGPGGGFKSPGNYGTLSLDAKGGKTMREIIAAGGSQTKYSVGDQVPTLTGQQTGNINKGFDDWAASNNDKMGSSCDDWDANHTYVKGKLQVTAKCAYRVVLIPIINEWPQGSKDVTILGFAQMYVAGFDPSDQGKITAVFLDDTYAHPNIILGGVDSYGTRIARISE